MKKIIEQLEKSIDIQEDILLEMQAETRTKEDEIETMTKLAHCLKLLETNLHKDAEWFFEHFLAEHLQDQLSNYFLKNPLLVQDYSDDSGEPYAGGYTDYSFTDFVLETELLTDYVTIPLKFDVVCVKNGFRSEFEDECCVAEIRLNDMVASVQIAYDGEVYEVEFKEVK